MRSHAGSIVCQGAAGPDYSARAIYLGGIEYECATTRKESIERRWGDVLGLVRGGDYFARCDDRCASEYFRPIRADISAK